MSNLQNLAYRYPLLPPSALIVALCALFYWVHPGAIKVFPIGGIPMTLMLLYNYRKYRNGNRQPLLRMAYRAVVALLTLAVLLLTGWLWNR